MGPVVFGHETAAGYYLVHGSRTFAQYLDASARPKMERLVDILDVGFACAYRHLTGPAHHKRTVPVDGGANIIA